MTQMKWPTSGVPRLCSLAPSLSGRLSHRDEQNQNRFSFVLFLLQQLSQLVMWQLLYQHEVHANRNRLLGWEQNTVRFQQWEEVTRAQ